MKTKILLTSFQTWLPHQKSNSSDDLLAAIAKLEYSDYFSLLFLRKLPVDVELATERVISKIEAVEPEVIICCGMAEKRDRLTIESNALCQNECLYTSVDLVELVGKLMIAEISHDAGKFVCEGLYYQILKYIQSQNKNIYCVFIHVPLLNNNSLNLIQRDFDSLFFWFASQISRSTKIIEGNNNH